jgi:hypothetical protein
MAKVFSFASWNVEGFRGRPDRFGRVVDVLTDNGPPDVFAIFEVKSSTTVFNEFTTRMPSHQFFITVTAKSPIDTLVGVNRNFTAYYEQRNEFTGGMPSLRPGALVTIIANGDRYSLLFVHLKAFDKPVAWGLRDDMVHNIRSLKRTLDNIAGADANMIALGDYNAVGLNVSYANNDMSDAEELTRYENIFANKNMSLIQKDQPFTLWGGTGSSYPPADADHIFASDQLDIRPGAAGNGVSVRGWPELATDALKTQWINQISDHAMLFGEVHG